MRLRPMNKNDHNAETPSARAVIFLHIPKTAGLTLRSIIRAQYPGQSIFDIDDVTTNVADFERLPEEKRALLRCVMGHVQFGVHSFLPQPSTYITMLREPVERAISYYYYVKSRGPNAPGGSHYLYRHVVENNISLLDFATTDLSPELNNGQARFISGLGGASTVSEILETAKRNLTNSFVAFGPCERFDEVLHLFRRTLGWFCTPYVRENVTADRPANGEISSYVIKRIEEYNSLDMELYDWSTRRFDEMLREYDGPRSLHRGRTGAREA